MRKTRGALQPRAMESGTHLRVAALAIEPPHPIIGALVGVHTNCVGGKRTFTREENGTAFRRTTIAFVVGMLFAVLLGVGYKASVGELLGYGADRAELESIVLPIVLSVCCALPVGLAILTNVLYRKSRPRHVRYIGIEGLHLFEKRMFGESRTIVRFADLVDVRVHRVRQFIQFAIGDPQYTGTSFDLVCTGYHGEVRLHISGIYNDRMPAEPWEPIAFADGAEYAYTVYQARQFVREANALAATA